MIKDKRITIAIIGSGAIGCLFGAYLSKNNDVMMLCRRQESADAINRHGITVFEPDRTAAHYTDNVRAGVSGSINEKADLVIVIVKGNDTEQSISENMGLIGDDTLVMTLQNGGGNDLRIAKYVPMERILIGTTRHNSVNLDKGNVRHSGSGITVIGSNTESGNVDDIVSLFNEAGIEAERSDDIQRILWNKLFVNLSINSFTAITKTPIGTMIDNDYAWFFAERLIGEAVEVAEAEGQHFSYEEVLDSVRNTCEKVADGFSSMSQDVMNCRKTEIDAINGFVVERAKVHNVPAPYNALVVNLIHAIENTYKEQIRTMTRFNAGDCIIRQGDVNEELLKVMQGTVSLYVDHGTENEYLLGVITAGKCFGAYNCYSADPSPYSAIADEDAVIMEVTKNDIRSYLALNPRNAEDMIAGMSRQISLAMKHVEMLNEELTASL